jgi:CSLREA domain-containing protein
VRLSCPFVALRSHERGGLGLPIAIYGLEVLEMSRNLAAGAALLSAGLSLAGPAWAQTYQVNDTGDLSDANTSDGICQTFSPGVCTLRAAVQQANVTGGLVQVPAITITLTDSIPIQRSMSIVGAGMRTTHVSGNGVYQIFNVSGGAAPPITVSISDMTLRDGNAVSYGGAIFLGNGDLLTVDRCFFDNNYAINGGAILSEPYSDLKVRYSVLTENHATNGSGGAVFALGSSLTLTNSAVHANTAKYAGGGLHLVAVSATITNATIAGNTSGEPGGGLDVSSTVDFPSNVTLLSSTVAQNRSYNGGGGGISVYQTSHVGIKNTIVAGNFTGCPLCFITESNCAGTVNSAGNSVVPSACTVSGPVLTGNPALGPLQENGGTNGPTYAPLAGSSAINTGTVGGCPLTDQRGVQRKPGVACEIGAYEVLPCGDVNGDGAVTVADVFFLINFLFAAGPFPPGLANVNGDGAVTVGDVFTLINFLFAGGTAPSCPGT